jgi:endonuclease G, mitochondrial
MASSLSIRPLNNQYSAAVIVAAASSFLWNYAKDDDETDRYPTYLGTCMRMQNQVIHTSNDNGNNNKPLKFVSNNNTLTTGDNNLPSPASPTLPIRLIQPNPNLEIAFDVRTRTPIYALETLTKATLSQKSSQRQQRPQFYEETQIEEPSYRSKLAHYRNSGWDRGHLAPAADYPQDRDTTFTLCNVAPQNHVMNLTLWCALEEWVRKVVVRNADNDSTVYVVTGPLWLPERHISDTTYEYRYQGLGRPPSLVAVPTHFFKVIAVISNNTTKSSVIQQFACFVVPNQDALPSKQLQDYIVPWRDLETVSGLQFFPQWATPEWKDHADYLTRQQQVESQRQQSQQKQINDSDNNSSPPLSTVLLLTDGSVSQTSTRTLWRRVKNTDITKEGLQHLCAFGKCR